MHSGNTREEKKKETGAPGWLSRLSLRLWLSHDLTVCGFEPRIRLCADCLLRAWGLLQILCLLLSLPLPHSRFVSLGFSKINKGKKNKKYKLCFIPLTSICPLCFCHFSTLGQSAIPAILPTLLSRFHPLTRTLCLCLPTRTLNSH